MPRTNVMTNCGDRDAAHSAPSFGDRRTYQLPSGSSGLAIRALLVRVLDQCHLDCDGLTNF
jgi:hypothetical protein